MKYKCICCGYTAENENVLKYIQEEAHNHWNEHCSHFWEPILSEDVDASPTVFKEVPRSATRSF